MKKTPSFKLYDASDAAITIQFFEDISEHLTKTIIQTCQLIRMLAAEYLLEVIPAYQTITIIYNPLKISNETIKARIEAIINESTTDMDISSQTVTIPVCYEKEFAPDLEHVAKHCNLSTEEVIKRHSQPCYLVHMLGFLPGFLYLGGLDEKLYCPRKKNPAIKIKQGSIAIGGQQTGIYPIESPGGWQIIGRTPIKTFNPQAELSFIASPLDRIKFVAITQTEFSKIEMTQL